MWRLSTHRLPCRHDSSKMRLHFVPPSPPLSNLIYPLMKARMSSVLWQDTWTYIAWRLQYCYDLLLVEHRLLLTLVPPGYTSTHSTFPSTTLQFLYDISDSLWLHDLCPFVPIHHLFHSLVRKRAMLEPFPLVVNSRVPLVVVLTHTARFEESSQRWTNLDPHNLCPDQLAEVIMNTGRLSSQTTHILDTLVPTSSCSQSWPESCCRGTPVKSPLITETEFFYWDM